MCAQPFRLLRHVLCTLLLPFLVNGSAQTLLTIGDSITSGFPHDAVSYQSKINDVLDPDPTYVGGQLGDPFVTGAGTIPIVGGDGYYVSRAPVVDGPIVGAVFTGNGMLETFDGGTGLGSADYIVVLAGANDLIQLISPTDPLDSFAPSTAGDYTTSGTFTDDNGVDPPVDHPVDSLISRYEDLLDSLAAAYPNASEIICLHIPPIDPAGGFVTTRLSPADATTFQTNVAAFNDQVWDPTGPSGLVHDKGDRFSFVDHGLLSTDVLDGLHPTNGGYEKIGDAVRLFVTNGNTAPVLDVIASKTVDELNLLTFTATATDVDTGDTLTFSLGESAIAGASITTGGVFSWTPGEEVGPGVYSIPVIVTDDGAGTLNHGQNVEVTVNEINTDPVLASVGDQSVDELVLLSFTATATDGDLPAETLSFSLSGSAPAGASITAGGEFTWTPTEAQGGSDYTFDVIVTDDGAGTLTDSETITVTVNEVNVAPVLANIDNASVNELMELTFTAAATDDDLPADTLTFSLGAGAPAGAGFTGGVFSWTPTEAQGPGVYTFDVVVTDDGAGTLSDSQEITLTVNDGNVPPVIDPISNVSVDELVELTFTATAMDSDIPAQMVGFTISGGPSGASITPAGVFTWTPSEAQGPGVYTITVNATDDGSGSLSDSTDFTVTVADINSPPVLDSIGDRTLGEGSSLNFVAMATDSDQPDDNLTFSLGAGAPAGASINAPGVFQWTLTDTQPAGDYMVEVIVTDDGVGTLTDSETITVTVVEPEVRIMTIGNSMTSGFPHGDTTSYQAFLDSNLTMPATYVGDDISPRVGDHGGFIVGGDGNIISRVPVVGGPAVPAVFPQTGAQENFESIKASVDEPNYVVVMLGTNDLTQLIAPKNPDLFMDVFTPDIVGDYTSAGVFTDNADGESVDHDVDSIIDRYEDLLDRIAAQFPSPEIICLPIPPIDTNGNFGGTGSEFDRAKATLDTTIPVYNAAIEARVLTKGDQFTFLSHGLTVSDISGDGLHPTNGGYEKIGIVVANFINGANAAPVLGAIGNQSVNELDELTFTASVTDDDAGDSHVFKLTGDVPVGAAITSAGIFTWTPTEAQAPGDYTFNVMVTDDGLGTLSDGEKITVTVNEVPLPPVLDAIGDQTVIELNELTFTATATDGDDPAEVLTYSLSASAPSGASITPLGGVFTWTPSGTDGGNDFTFEVIVTDSSPSAETDSEIITVTVFEFNTAPVLDPIGNLQVNEFVEVAFTATATDGDVPADTLTFTLDGNEPAGAAITTGGNFTWTPSEVDGPGVFTFGVIVTDDGGGTLSDSETISITVLEVNVPPVLDPVGNKSVDELVELAFTVTGTDVDVPQQPFSFGLPNPPSGASINASTGEFTWTPTDAQSGEHTIEIIFSDGIADDRETITVTVADINEPPVLDSIGAKTVGELATLRFIATAQDIDDPADTLTFSVVNEPAGLTINGVTGEVRWSLSAAQIAGDYTFDVVVTDDGIGALSDSETITVTVVEPEFHIMTIGDSMTSGLPHSDGISYHTYLDENLNIPATYVGDPGMFSDSGARIVGGDGSMINKLPSAAVFPNNGVQEIFSSIKSTVTVPDYVVIGVGTNDLIQLISPKDQTSPDTFVPDTAGDFTSGGIFTDSDGGSSTQHTVSPIMVRYESLLDEIAAQFPSSTKIISLAMPPVDATVTFSDAQTELAKGELATTVPTFNTKLQTLVGGKGSRFVFLDPALTLAQIGDGIHPTTGGYEQVGITIANYINGNKNPVLDLIGNQTVAELATLTFTATAMDEDGDDLTFSLSAGAPAGASINANSGVFTWTPTAAQGPNTYSFEVIVTDDGFGEFQDSETIMVEVTGPGDPYTDWLATHFSASDLNDSGKEATVWGRQANPDGGDWTNEFEFYLGMDPNVVDEPDFEIVDTPTGAKALYQKNENAPLSFITVEWSISLFGWTDDGVTRQVTGPASDGTVPVEADVTSASDRVFFQFLGETP